MSSVKVLFAMDELDPAVARTFGVGCSSLLVLDHSNRIRRSMLRKSTAKNTTTSNRLCSNPAGAVLLVQLQVVNAEIDLVEVA